MEEPKPKQKPTDEESIQQLLEEYNPSELDEAVKAVCPFYEPEDRKYSKAYLDFHEYCRVGILTGLQIEFGELEVSGERKTETGQVDGSVYSVRLEDNDVFLYDGDEPTEKIALVEVKTGNIKPLQAAAYAYTEGKPTIIAEVRRGKCHLVDQETAAKLLKYAQNQLENLAELRDRGKRIPDRYLCESCGNRSCEHWNGRGSELETKYIIRDRTKQLSDYLPETVEELVSIVRDLLEEKGLSVR